MPSNVKIAVGIFLCLMAMFGYVYGQKKQFYPTVVYMSKSGATIAVCYAEALVLGLILSTILRRIFFGELRPIESERLAERSWYALTETCLAFTIFKEETVPVFVFLFALLIFIKTFHWLTEERVDIVERSMVISKLFHVRIIAVFLLLGAVDVSFITYAYFCTINKGPSIQLVFGFEYCILLIMLVDNLVKYALYIHALLEFSTAESRTITQMHVAVVMNTIKVMLYSTFFLLMIQIFTFPLFVLRPMYFTLKAFKKSVMNVLMTRRALKYLNTFYPNATTQDLETHDSACIICREDLSLVSKKLPCGHIFHTSCLRAWFQRQQTCPTCRYSILKIPQSVQLERLRSSRSVDASTQTECNIHENETTPHFHFVVQGNAEELRSNRILVQPELLNHASEEELTNLENQRKMELKLKIQKLAELTCMIDEASLIFQEGQCSSQSSGASAELFSKSRYLDTKSNVRLIRERRLQSLKKTGLNDSKTPDK